MEGNQMKMREALDAALRFIGNLEIEPYSPLDEEASELRQRIMDALSEPPRQCDIGTPEEQERRYKATGEVYHTLTLANALAWAQTPYDAKE